MGLLEAMYQSICVICVICGLKILEGDVVLVGGDDVFEELVLLGGPEAGGEDFDFGESVETGGADGAVDGFDVDAAFAHEAAVVEEVGGGGEPVADVEADDAFAGAGDFLIEVGVPPDVIDIGGDADVGVAELVDDVVALAEGVDRAAAVGIHRVEGFDGELDAG